MLRYCVDGKVLAISSAVAAPAGHDDEGEEEEEDERDDGGDDEYLWFCGTRRVSRGRIQVGISSYPSIVSFFGLFLGRVRLTLIPASASPILSLMCLFSFPFGYR